LVAASRPDPIKRLQSPQGLADTGSQSAPPPRRKAERAAAPRRNKGRKMKLHKRLERYITAIFKLGRTEWTAKQAARSARHAEDLANNHAQDLGRIWQSISELEKAHDTFGPHLDRRVDTQMESYKAGLAALSRTISDLTRRLDRLMMREGEAPGAPQSGAGEALGGEGFTAFKDQFYHRLENRYRGSREEIANRLRIYLPDVEAAVQRTGGKPVMDLGCGRGEWLQVLGEAGVENAFGVDTNPVQIHEAQELGLDVRQGDAVRMLAEAKDASLSVITAHHLIEHLPFDTVAWITREALRVLAPGGLLMFETPNTRNVLVGATTFHTDPTHIKPMPEQVMGVLFETAGFYPVDIRHLNAHERFDEFRAKPDFNDELAFLMFGPQDLAVLGLKPQDKE
jgi:O-antigen chain-terminating methyltransferase